MMWFVCHQPLMPRGSNFLLLRQKKVTKAKATPTFALIRDLKRKRRAVRNSLRSNNGPLHRRFRFKSRRPIDVGPVGRIFDRSAMKTTRTRMRAILLSIHSHEGESKSATLRQRQFGTSPKLSPGTSFEALFLP